MTTQIENLIASLNTAKASLKTIVTTAKAEAAKGTKMPVGQHAQSEGMRKITAALATDVAAQGFVPMSSRFSKDGRSFIVTHRVPVTLAERLASHKASTERRAAVIAQRKAAKAAAEVAKNTPATVAVPSNSAISALANVKLAA